jgi:predicted nucleic acid-binding protein
VIAVDTSSLSALLAGADGDDTEKLIDAMRANAVVLPPAVLTEILSDPKAAPAVARKLGELELLEITEGFWRRAGETRAKLKVRGLKANLGDSLIAQSCLDHGLALITRDEDFRHFAKHCGLRLA